MTHQEVQNRSEVIFRFLSQKRLKNAFEALVQLMYEHGLLQYEERLERLQTTYKYMLRYAVESAHDPEREKIYKQLFADTYRVCDEIQQNLLDKYSSHLPYSLGRPQTELFSEKIQGLLSAKTQYEAMRSSGEQNVAISIKTDYLNRLSEVFAVLWGTHFYTDQFVLDIQAIVNDNKLKDYELSLLSSAITLSLWRSFDEGKFAVLFALSTAASDLVRQRAFVGILIAVYIYSERLPYFSAISSRFTILSEEREFIKSLESIIIQFIRSKESEKIAKRFSEEIIPEMAKIAPYMQEKFKSQREDEEHKGDEDDKNPDWQEILDEVPGLSDKMKEISEMQMEGADVFLSTFSMLKTFPFFAGIHNWLVPFSLDYPELSEETKKDENQRFVQAMRQSHFLCNSDKYSFLLSIEQLPATQKQQMASAMNEEIEGMKEIEKEQTALNKNWKTEFISNQYIQDLYRFFNLHPRKTDFDNIFQQRLDFHNKKSIACLIEDDGIWRNVAEYYFSKNHFNEATELYDKLLEKEAGDVEMLQKRGYCAQKMSKFQMALDFYLKADLVESNNSWTVKKIAFCYRALGDNKNALAHYLQAIDLQPKNKALQLSAGHCYLSLGQYDDALNTYFKIEMESSKPQKAWRPIAWCLFISGKLERAQAYYSKIMKHQPTPHDYVNAGHAALASHNNAQALDYYKDAVTNLEGGIEQFLSIFNEDKAHLLNYGIEESDLPIFLDSLRYRLE